MCEFVLAECRGLDRPLDMRLLVNALGDYLQDTEFHAGCSWREVVATRILERPTHFREAVAIGGREDRRRQELDAVRMICSEVEGREERLRLWQEQTGKSQAAFYRRLKEHPSASTGTK